ncbi:hypothetical protein [Hyalangium versicolor]|uniref:hypothetical protein n=1 Tax=Hyalangium versicolor TaxID=2861190 RepID=UPI001CCBCB05|nr:hypothetical protein [Hyalangium versicolor]
MNVLELVQASFRGPWGCIAVTGVIVLVILMFSFIPRNAQGQSRSPMGQGGASMDVGRSVLQQARQLVQEGKPLVAVKLLRDTSRVSLGDAQAYVKAVQAAQQGGLSFGEALTAELASEVKTLISKADREQAVKLLVARAGAPEAEARRLVELMGSTRSHRAWLAKKPLPGVGTEADLEQVESLVAEGKKAEALTLYRKLTGASLEEAKEYVDALAEP